MYPKKRSKTHKRKLKIEKSRSKTNYKGCKKYYKKKYSREKSLQEMKKI